MNQLLIFILLVFPIIGYAQKTGLIFQSGFEHNTKIVGQNSKTAEIVGKDYSLKSLNDWDKDLGMNLNIGYFNIQYQGGDRFQRLAEIVNDPVDPSNKVLKFWIKHPNVKKRGKIQANLYNNNGIKELDYSIRLFLPSDFNVVKSAPFKAKLLTLMEFWNNANWQGEDYQFRISVNLQKIKIETDSLRIGIESEVKNAETGKWSPLIWEYTNKYFVVPIEQWMTINIHFVEGDCDHGRFMVSITPECESSTIVHDVYNFTHHPDDPAPDGLSHFNVFKLYTTDDLISHVTKSGKLLSLFWDDFRLSINKSK